MTDKPPMREMTLQEYLRWAVMRDMAELAMKRDGVEIVASHKKPKLNVVPLKANDEDH